MNIVKQYDITSLHFDIESQYTVTTIKQTITLFHFTQAYWEKVQIL